MRGVIVGCLLMLATVPGATVTGATVTGATVTGATVTGATVTGATATGAAAQTPPSEAEATVTVKGLDALIQQVRGDRHLSRLLAALILCKGLGQTEPDGTTTYRIDVTGGKASVNGVEITTLLGGR